MKLYTKCTSTAATTEFVWKIFNTKKISYEHFNLCEAEIFLNEIIKQTCKITLKSEITSDSPQNESKTNEPL